MSSQYNSKERQRVDDTLLAEDELQKAGLQTQTVEYAL